MIKEFKKRGIELALSFGMVQKTLKGGVEMKKAKKLKSRCVKCGRWFMGYSLPYPHIDICRKCIKTIGFYNAKEG